MPKTLVEKYKAILIFPDRSGSMGFVLDCQALDRFPASGFDESVTRRAGKIRRLDQKKGG
jgi:hypothetical protein